MSLTENKNIVEVHGCIVCARPFNILVVYNPNGRLVGCTITSSGGHVVPGKPQPLVACDIHPAEKIEAAYKRWQARNAKESDDEQEKE
jgi:hypothetical protein